MEAEEEWVGRGTVRAGRDRGLGWAAVAWVVAALVRGAEAQADPARAVAAERTCGNPAEAAAVRAAGGWELEGSGPARAVAGRVRVVEAVRAQARVAVEEQVLALVQVGERELAVG